jgi:N-acyl homoserine lactone hydrolase
LIVTSAGRTILVDTGNPRTLIGQARALPWFDAPLKMTEEDSLAERLSSIGHAVGGIDLLVATHFDFDHCGNNDLFDGTGIECFAQRAMLNEAETGDRYDRALWDRPGVRYQGLTGNTEIEQGITLLESSGHAVGHQSVLVETKEGSLLLTIDAIPEPNALMDGPLPSFYVDDGPAWSASREKLTGLAETTGAVMIFGHDPRQVDLLPATGPIRLTEELRQSGSPERKAL